MNATIEIKEKKIKDDYFPSLFVSGDKTVVILADERTSEKTFSGMVIYCEGESRKKSALGTYSTGWPYDRFKRLPKGSEITIIFEQENG